MIAPSSPEPTAPRRVVGRPFAKGMSGNPGGRPASVVERVRRLAGKYKSRAMRTLVQLMEDDKQPADERRKAAETVLAYYAGRPAVVQEVSGRGGAPVGPLVNVTVGAGLGPEAAIRLMTQGILPADPTQFAGPALEHEATPGGSEGVE